jgi:hypothetical protein
MTQWHCSVGGHQHGPVDDEEMRARARDGRLRPADHVWTEGMSAWAPAGSVTGLFPAEGVTAAPRAVYYAPHRGGPILGLGILSVLLAFLLGIGVIPGVVAWVGGNKDIREIGEGRVDPAGRGMVVAGRILGVIGTILGCVSLLFWTIYSAVIASITVRG